MLTTISILSSEWEPWWSRTLRCLYHPYRELVASQKLMQSGGGASCFPASTIVEPIGPTCYPYTTSPNSGGGGSGPTTAFDFHGNIAASGDPYGSCCCCSCQSLVSTPMHPSPVVSLTLIGKPPYLPRETSPLPNYLLFSLPHDTACHLYASRAANKGGAKVQAPPVFFYLNLWVL